MNRIGSGKGLTLPSRFCLKGIIFFLSLFFVLFCLFVCFLFCFVVVLFCFLVCEQLLKAIVDPLVVKTTKVLDLAHEKERVALWCS